MSSTASRRLTEFLLSDIVSISADAIICIDADQNITLFNQGAEQIFGWTAEEAIGKPLDILLPERVRDIHRVHVERFGRSDVRARRMGERRDISGLRKNGEEFPAEAAIAKVHMGGSVVFSVVMRDITDQVALQRRLQAAIQARDDVVSVVAHDLRNPVSAVKMLSHAVLQRAAVHALDEESAEQLRLIREAAEQMDALIQDLLDISRVETGRLVIEPERAAMADVIDGALATLRPLIDQAGLVLETKVEESLPLVRADRERIGQVLSNLVGNALKFTDAGGRLTIGISRDDVGVRVAVTDTGVGIPPEHLPYVFDRFWQSSPSALRSRGAGLGLPIARGIIEAHGGRLWAESVPGRGSTFYFTVPAA